MFDITCKDDYTTTRDNLMIEVRQCLADENPKDAEAIMDEIDILDNEWEDFKVKMANSRALHTKVYAPISDFIKDNEINFPIGNLPAVPEGAQADIEKMTVKAIEDPVTVDISDNTKNNIRGEQTMNFNEMTIDEIRKSEAYTTAWAKSLQGKPLTEDENTAYRMVNEDFEHTTENTGSVVPDTIADGIWAEVEDMYPYFADITKTNVSGLLTVVKATESTEASWYDEDTETETGKETFETIQLAGCELSRAISVSWKLKEMAIADFIPYIQRRMAEAMGAALGYGVVQGKGADADTPEPMGIITALEADKNQVVSGDASYKTITTARGKIKSGYANGIAVYANSETIWGSLANITDENGHPLFIHDAASEDGVFRILGMPVKEDASVPTGYILMSNASRGYQGNVNKDITVVTEDHARQRITDYVGYAIFDGAPLTYLAHSLIKLGE